MKNKREWGRVLKFTLFSISAGAIEMASFALLNELLHGSYWPCYLIALTLSVLWNFTLNRKFTFQSANNVPQAMALVLLAEPLLRRRLHRWQGAACLVLYFLYLAAVSFAPRAGA